MPITWFLVAAIILVALYLRRMPLHIGPPGPPRIVGPVGDGMPSSRPHSPGVLSP